MIGGSKMANLTKLKRDEMIKFLEELKVTHSDDSSIKAFNEIENALTEKKFGLVFEEHTEAVDEKLEKEIPVFYADETRKICKDKNLPYNFIIEGDNLQALYLLEKTHRGKIDCIYIDPPYNTGAKDWKYNNDYVDGNDNYRHSKWLSMMKTRLLIAKRLLNPKDSTLICTIDEKEYAHLGCLLEELFPNATIQMISCMINPATVARKNQFGRTDEYIYYVFIGESGPQKLALSDDWMTGVKNSTRKGHHWNPLMRTGSGNMRKDAPNCFYPVFVSEDGKQFCGVGESLPLGVDRNTVKAPEGQIAIWPIHLDESEGRWRYSRTGLIEIQKGGFVKLGGLTPRGMALSYLAEGERKKIESGEYKVVGKREDGSLIIDDSGYVAKYIPGTQWTISNHDASRNGTNLIQKIIGNGRFTFPKSLYSVYDAINFVVANKPDAIILDFFAGSGTTQHAVNLLNKIDGGNRKCIMVTNNEISVEEETRLTKLGIKKGDPEWENLGIAKYVTWPRTKCSIEGVTVERKPIKGEYLINDLEGNAIPIADGFNCNIKYFVCDWTPRKPEDYLLSNVLCLHVKEMIEIENAIEIDNVENVVIFNRDDYCKYILNDEKYNGIKRLWVNQNIIFSSDEIKQLENKNFKYIPREYFGQELKEAAE
jgi:adenine-specific DNA-methyltransferase